MKAPVFAISRLRMGTDGKGVTTLVAFMGCPLKCMYCLNQKCHEPIFEQDGKTLRKGIMMLTPQELYDMVKIDNIYFQSTGGGICFGGGEPGLQSEFITEFKQLCGDKWKITIETCGCIAWNDYQKLAPVVDHWIVDIKALNPFIYKEYTEVEVSGVSQHLVCIKRLIDLKKVTIKVPHIPDFTTPQNVHDSIDELKRKGFTDIQEVHYIKRLKNH